MLMHLLMSKLVFIFSLLIHNVLSDFGHKSLKSKNPYNDLGDHTMVTDSNVFPYAVAILKKNTYISAGALISEKWVLTGGDALFLLRESAREIRVRMGSINYKKGGVSMPIKFFDIHPYFSDVKPEYDIAMIKLPRSVRFTQSLNPIKIQKRPREVTATHFIVTSWPGLVKKSTADLKQIKSMEVIKKRRILTVSHLHPSSKEKCVAEMEGLDINATNTLMCLDPPMSKMGCSRDVGAPVVLNGILWGIISSWKSEDCEDVPGPSFVTLVSAPDIKSWIHANLKGKRWSKQQYRVEVKDDDVDYEYDYDDREE